ncbi:hypothetical protein GCM10020367_70490 [Streptomyces sannanensis]|uniref:Uncharacterized protein n=1 Tax=Streptomyces sannanensis TaxID=285536 RepID=A0ABP6SNF1_9ACTN
MRACLSTDALLLHTEPHEPRTESGSGQPALPRRLSRPRHRHRRRLADFSDAAYTNTVDDGSDKKSDTTPALEQACAPQGNTETALKHRQH